MIKVPECLSKRYKALDDIIQELSMSISSQQSLCEQRSNTSNVGIKLMCDFWNILRDDPDCNLTAEVQQRMGTGPTPQSSHNVFGIQRYITYMAGKSCRADDNNNKKCRIDVPIEDDQKASGACCSGSKKQKDSGIALSKVLCNLKQAATFDKKCHTRVKELMEAQKELKNQIQLLEYREREGVKLLKEADCMWLCMEDAYKKKVAESQDRQQFLLKQLKEIETSAAKWRKNKKDLEFQTDNMTKARMEIVEKMNQKKNDIKIMDIEVKNLTRRVESAKKDLENSKKSICSTKEAADTRMKNLTEEMVKIQKKTNEEKALMKKKENEGTQYVKDTRVDLQNICKVLLQKKLENEDLRAERTAVLEEIDLLTTTFDSCKDRCKNKEESVLAELKTLRNEVSTFQAKCKRCHVCTDTNDVRKLCTDCPKCMEERSCKVDDEHCVSDPTMDCVCMSVKQRFLDNVFDNMYTVLERQSKTQPGKALADVILKSLRKSTNGKLTPEIRRILQDFILSTVKKNLNLTIVGGAVKTRCELDPDTYKQLMNCLKTVKAKKPPQEDKGTASKKDPCKRWGATSECNCPRGPKDCVCTKKAPPHPKDPRPCPQDREDIGEQKTCPFKEGKVCGPDCGMQGKTSGVKRDIGSEMTTWRPDPCSGPSCPYSKITRAALAQCVLGPESIEKSVSRKNTCTCKTTQLKSCYCNRDRRSQPREKIVDEVMGRYNEVPPIAKVTGPVERYFVKLNNSAEDTVCDCSNFPTKYVLAMSVDTKHLNVNLVEYGDKNTSVQHWGDSQKDVRFEVPCVQQEFNIQTDAIGLTDNEQNLTSVSCQFNSLESSFIHTMGSKQEILSKEFKIAIDNNSGQTTSQFTVLTKSRSGTLAMELDEEIIESIQSKTSENPFLFVSLKKSNSGHLIIHFDNKGDGTSNCQKILLRNTKSGTNFLEIHKNVIDIIEATEKYNTKMDSTRSMHIPKDGMTKDCNARLPKGQEAKTNLASLKAKNNKISEFHNQTRDSSSKYVLIRNNNGQNMNQRRASNESADQSLVEKAAIKKNEHMNSAFNRKKIEKKSPQDVKSRISKVLKSPEPNKLHDYSLELQRLFEQGNVAITLQIKVKNKLYCKFKSVITRSLSESIGVNLVVQLAYFEHIPLDGAEYPVCLSKTKSDTYIINIDQCHGAFNAVLKKSVGGNVMLIPTTPQIKVSENTSTDICSEKVFKLKVNSLNGYVQLPAVLKLTLSNNFIIILDKEFENRYKATLQNNMGTERECFVSLEKTRSGYILDLNTNNALPPEKLNALLVKSILGDVKIFVQRPNIKCIDTTTTNRSPISSAQVFGDLLGKLQSTLSNKFDIKHFRNPKFVAQKSVSDTQLYERVRVKLQINKSLFSKPSAVLKKTESGQYAIILNKESKKTFLNNLRSFLVSNPKGLIPITRTDSGEILINLNRYDEAKGQYGSLKITPSGNVYILVDAEAIENMTNNFKTITKQTNAVDTRSFNLMDTVNKGVCTTCNAKPCDGDCDVSKCVCGEMPFETLEWKNCSIDQDREKFSQPVCWVSSKSITIENVTVSKTGAGTDKICMKPTSESQYKCTEHCCYVFDTVCPRHNDLYNYVDNELNDSSICKEEQQLNIVEFKAYNDNEYPQVGQVLWDSLSYLPPQLPPFLRNVRYR